MFTFFVIVLLIINIFNCPNETSLYNHAPKFHWYFDNLIPTTIHPHDIIQLKHGKYLQLKYVHLGFFLLADGKISKNLSVLYIGLFNTWIPIHYSIIASSDSDNEIS